MARVSAALQDWIIELGRALDSAEEEVVQHISPQGIAKINRDTIKGISCEKTLADITTAFGYMKKRRLEVAECLPQAAHDVIALMRRPPSTDEMAMLADIPAPYILAKIAEQLNLQKGDEFEDVVEELATAYRHQQLLNNARALSNLKGLPISLIKLAPTSSPTAANLTAANMAKFGTDRIYIGPSPIAVWFDELPKEQEQTYITSDSSSSSRSITPPLTPTPVVGVLKKPNSTRFCLTAPGGNGCDGVISPVLSRRSSVSFSSEASSDSEL